MVESFEDIVSDVVRVLGKVDTVELADSCEDWLELGNEVANAGYGNQLEVYKGNTKAQLAAFRLSVHTLLDGSPMYQYYVGMDFPVTEEAIKEIFFDIKTAVCDDKTESV